MRCPICNSQVIKLTNEAYCTKDKNCFYESIITYPYGFKEYRFKICGREHILQGCNIEEKTIENFYLKRDALIKAHSIDNKNYI